MMGSQGLAFAVGSNEGGELALGHSRPVFGFKPIRHVSLAQGSGGDEGTSAAAGHFVAAACGYRFSTAAAAGGTQLLSCGLNTASCQLGHGRDHLAEGDEAVVPLLRLISPPSDAQSQPITMLACGFDHTVALTSQGCVLSWGERNSGQLGVDNDMCSRPQLVETLAGKRVVHVSAGGSHSLVVALPGDVWAFGSNLRGQLGNGVVAVADDDVDREKPVRVHLPDGVLISACAGGGLHSLALARDGRIYSWGCNIKGQCGVNSGGEGGRDVLFPHLVHVSEIDELVASQGNGTGGWKMVSAGFSHSVALSHTGRVFTWGQCHALSSDEGVSHVPIEMCLDQYRLEGVRSHSRVEWVAAAASHSVAVLGDRVVTWGRKKSQRREEPSPPRSYTSVVQHPVASGPCASHMIFIYSPSQLSWAFERVLWIGVIKDSVPCAATANDADGGSSRVSSTGPRREGPRAASPCLLALLPQDRRYSSSLLRHIISFAAAPDSRDLERAASYPALSPAAGVTVSGGPVDPTGKRSDGRVDGGGDDPAWACFE